MRVWICAAIVAAAALVSSAAQAADQGLVRITGAKQGAITGAGIQAIDFHYSVTSPTDAASGLPTGKRQQKPVTVTLPWSAAAPQLFEAAVQNETLTSVVFTNTGGARFSVELTNARIADFQISDANGKEPGIDPVVTISLTFQKITISDVTGGKTAADDWEARQ